MPFFMQGFSHVLAHIPRHFNKNVNTVTLNKGILYKTILNPCYNLHEFEFSAKVFLSKQPQTYTYEKKNRTDLLARSTE